MKNTYKFTEEYLQRTYAGWLGKIIGIRLGSPIEGWSHEQIQREYGEITGYLVDYQDYAADDDSNGPLFFIRALIDYAEMGNGITEKEMGDTWLNYVAESHGFFWWGGYGVSSEHTAYENLRGGIPAPLSGSRQLNGKICSEQIGGQIFSDCWGFVNPGNPRDAAEYAKKMSRVSHDGEGVYGGMFVAACISASYVEDTVIDIINTGLSVIPYDCEYATVTRDIIDFYNNDLQKNWRSCLAYIHKNYGYDKYPGVCHIIPNSAVVILSLLYGEGSFTTSQCICNMCGWDTDCNAGTIGSILGVFVGIDQIDDAWIIPIKDLLIASSVLGSLNIQTIAKSAELFCSLGFSLAKTEIPERWKSRMDISSHILHFDLKKSTQAFRTSSTDPSVVMHIENTDEVGWDGHRSLKITAKGVCNNEKVYAFIKTYYTPDDLHDSRYDPSFTPIVFPGQRIQAVVRGLSQDPVVLRLYAYDSNQAKTYFSQSVYINDIWTSVDFHIPALPGGLIKQIGLELTNPSGDSAVDNQICIYMDRMEISGIPQYSVDFSRERVEVFKQPYGKNHQEISQFSYLNGFWELDGDFLSGSCSTEGEAYTGYYSMEDYAVHCVIKPQTGYYHLLNVRVQGAIRSYAFGFYGEDTVAFVRKQGKYFVLDSVAYAYELGREYHFHIIVKDRIFTLFINDIHILTYHDDNCVYQYGQVGLTVLHGSHCHFKNLRIERVSADIPNHRELIEDSV